MLLGQNDSNQTLHETGQNPAFELHSGTTAQEFDALCSPDETDRIYTTDWQEFNLWDRIGQQYSLDIPTNSRIESQFNWFVKHPEYLERVLKRGSPYLFHIVEQLEQRNMPIELAFLPIVESAFDPFAYSPGRASGMWQIIPGTGKMLGLKQSWWYDGRRDVVASTDAALNYLERLNKRFNGDWNLALAAYNSGAGTVNRAIRKAKKKGKPTDYWNLSLPKETQAYVPKLLALVRLIKNAETHGITLQPISNTAQFVQVALTQQIDLAQAADLAGIDINELYRFNPGFNRWATDPSGPHRIVLPVSAQQAFEHNIALVPQDELVTWRRHTIKSGETLSHIAARYNVSIDTITSINNIRRSTIRAGDTLLVPTASKGSQFYRLSAEQRLKRKQNAAPDGKHKLRYTVQPGDSFWAIARKHKVSSSALARWNSMAPRDTLRIGQTLVVWTDQVSAPTGVNDKIIRKLSYRVRNGDSLYKIASKFRVNVDDILRWNQISKGKYLQPGQSLVLYVDVRNT